MPLPVADLRCQGVFATIGRNWQAVLVHTAREAPVFAVILITAVCAKTDCLFAMEFLNFFTPDSVFAASKKSPGKDRKRPHKVDCGGSKYLSPITFFWTSIRSVFAVLCSFAAFCQGVSHSLVGLINWLLVPAEGSFSQPFWVIDCPLISSSSVSLGIVPRGGTRV